MIHTTLEKKRFTGLQKDQKYNKELIEIDITVLKLQGSNTIMMRDITITGGIRITGVMMIEPKNIMIIGHTNIIMILIQVGTMDTHRTV